MKYTQYKNADDFLKRMRDSFERTESVNGLMFGLCFQLKKNLFKYGEQQPLFAIVEDDLMIQIAALMTHPYKLQLCAPNSFSVQSIKTLANGLIHNQWNVPTVIADKCLAESFVKEWKKRYQCQSREGMKQRIHELRNVQILDYAHGEFRQADAQDLATAITWAREFHVACFGNTEPDNSVRFAQEKVQDGGLFFWVDPLPVSMAARTRPTPNGESIGLVYTPLENRRCGYARSVVARLSQQIFDEGKQFCCLYTDLDNPTSNSIYRKIGYFPVADVVDIHFEY